MLSEIDALARASLSSLLGDLFGPGWNGRREREVVSLFCFGHLLSHCRPGTFLSDPTQIAIEVAVPQIAGQKSLSGSASSKGQVCKDIVIWPRPRMTCWDDSGRPTIRPSCVFEWKHDAGGVAPYDVQWLTEFSRLAEDFVGYAVCTNQKRPRSFRLSCTRVYKGKSEPRWVYVE